MNGKGAKQNKCVFSTQVTERIAVSILEMYRIGRYLKMSDLKMICFYVNSYIMYPISPSNHSSTCSFAQNVIYIQLAQLKLSFITLNNVSSIVCLMMRLHIFGNQWFDASKQTSVVTFKEWGNLEQGVIKCKSQCYLKSVKFMLVMHCNRFGKLLFYPYLRLKLHYILFDLKT